MFTSIIADVVEAPNRYAREASGRNILTMLAQSTVFIDIAFCHLDQLFGSPTAAILIERNLWTPCVVIIGAYGAQHPIVFYRVRCSFCLATITSIACSNAWERSNRRLRFKVTQDAFVNFSRRCINI